MSAIEVVQAKSRPGGSASDSGPSCSPAALASPRGVADSLGAPRPGIRVHRLCIVTASYPSAREPSAGAFVQVFARAVAGLGVTCSVVQPVALHEAACRGLKPVPGEDGWGGEEPTVLRRSYVSLSTRRIAGLRLSSVTQRTFVRAALRAVRFLDPAPDTLYGHFMFPAGAAAIEIGQRLGIPAFVGVGEGRFWSIKPFGVGRARRDLSGAAGFVAVSTPIAGKLSNELGISRDRIAVFPNGADTRLFYPRGRAESRRSLGWSADDFIVGFVGHFVDSKGPLRVLEAINGIDGALGVFLGRGPQRPSGPKVLWSGEMHHDALPVALSACDAFVLPTTHEGSSNAVAEAMACGLPIVTSLGDFMDDLVDETVAIRVDPYDIDGIRQAMKALMTSPTRRHEIAAAALKRGREHSAAARARGILCWMATRRTEAAPDVRESGERDKGDR